MASGFSIVSLLFLLLSAGGGDLLDLVATDAFWKSKNVAVGYDTMAAELASEDTEDVSALVRELGSDDYATRDAAQTKLRAMGRRIVPHLRPATQAATDAEIASRANLLLEQIEPDDKALAVRRLMAIRTLGEMKEARALPLLRTLVESQEQFVAAYARRAIASIEGTPLPPARTDRAALASDVALLPANGRVVARAEWRPRGALELSRLIEKLPPEDGREPAERLEEMTLQVVVLVERIGNVRLEGVTLALSDDVGDERGHVVAIVRGEYDVAAVAREIADATGMEKSQRGDVTLLRQRNMLFLLPSPDRLIFVGGPDEQLLPTDALLAALKSGKGTLHESSAISAVLERIDTTKPVWLAAAINDHYRQMPVLAPFDDVRLVGDMNGERLEFRIDAAGKDPAAVSAAADRFTNGVTTAAREARQLANDNPGSPIVPLLNLLDSLKCTTNGPAASVTGSVDVGPGSLLGLPMFLGLSFEREVHGVER